MPACCCCRPTSNKWNNAIIYRLGGIYHLANWDCLLGIIRPTCRPRAAHSEIKDRALSLNCIECSRKCMGHSQWLVYSLLHWPLIRDQGRENGRKHDFFQSRNPGIKPRQSRDFGIGKVGRDPGIPGFGIPGLQSLLTMNESYKYNIRITKQRLLVQLKL